MLLRRRTRTSDRRLDVPGTHYPPAGTAVEVSPLNTSRADAPVTELVRQVIENPKPPPIPFVLENTSGRSNFSLSVRFTPESGHSASIGLKGRFGPTAAVRQIR